MENQVIWQMQSQKSVSRCELSCCLNSFKGPVIDLAKINLEIEYIIERYAFTCPMTTIERKLKIPHNNFTTKTNAPNLFCRDDRIDFPP